MNIEPRVARLDAQNRLLKGVALMALAVSVLPWMMGSDASIQDHVQARRFTLIGNDDAPAGSWSFDQETKTATLSVQSSPGSPTVVLGSSGDHATVRLLTRITRSPDIALTAGHRGTTIEVKDGMISIERGGKTALSRRHEPLFFR